MSYIYDEEAVIQDADIEMAEMIARGNHLARLERMGVCVHDGVIGVSDSGKIFYPEQVGLTGEQHKCWECGQVFESIEEWVDAVRSL
jgi:tRNA U54 and U55 pseudouridine synthase Pus10